METKTKKLLAIITILAIMLLVLPFNTSKAASVPTISVGSAECKTGETFNVDVKLDQTLTTSSLNTYVEFDKQSLEVTNIAIGNSLTGLNATVVNPDVNTSNQEGKVQFVLASAENINIPAGKIATITFKTKSGVVGNKALKAVVEELAWTNPDYSTEERKDTGVKTTSGSVNITNPVQKVTLNKTKANLQKGASEKLSITSTTPDLDSVYPKPNITWISSDTKVATVEQDGTVKAVGNGTATISVKVGNVSASCEVSVTNPIKGVKLEKDNIEMLKGKSTKLNYSFVCDGEPYPVPEVKWTSSNEKVATVAQDGTVTAVGKNGETAEITVSANGFSAKCTITVKEIPLDSVEISKEDFVLNYGSSDKLTVLLNPENATVGVQDAVWESSDENVVRVTKFGDVSAVGAGEATITVTLNGKTSSVKITVPEVLIEGINAYAYTDKLNVGDELTVMVETNPYAVTEKVNITFKSSDEKVLSVDENGIVKALKPGKATITVKVNDKFEDEYEIEVVEESANNGGLDSDVPKTGVVDVTPIVMILMVISIAGISILLTKKSN